MDIERIRTGSLWGIAILVIISLVGYAIYLAVTGNTHQPYTDPTPATTIVSGTPENYEPYVLVTARPGEGWLAIGRRVCGVESMRLAQKNANLNGCKPGFVPLGKFLKVMCQ